MKAIWQQYQLPISGGIAGTLLAILFISLGFFPTLLVIIFASVGSLAGYYCQQFLKKSQDR